MLDHVGDTQLQEAEIKAEKLANELQQLQQAAALAGNIIRSQPQDDDARYVLDWLNTLLPAEMDH